MPRGHNAVRNGSNTKGYFLWSFMDLFELLDDYNTGYGWNKGNVFNNVINLKEKLKSCQENIDKNPHDKMMKKLAVDSLNEYSKAVKDELSLLKQKAKINWMKNEDKKSAYFHRILKARRNKSRVESICDDQGNRFKGEQVAEQFVKHFECFLGISRPVTSLNNDIFINTLFVEEAEAWEVIGKDFCYAVKEFFSSGKLLGEINATIIALIPKVNTPHKVSEFRPIACCTVLYKCISKILTNRIKSGLDKIVHINQSAFIPGRHIQDNILIAQELLSGYNRINGPSRCAMQIDIQKAYDTVNWSFMERTLVRFGFHRAMINWIMQCITSLKFSICLNRETHGYFKGGRGNKDSLLVIKKSLEEFGQMSGLTANLGKSIIFFGSIKEEVKQELFQILPFKCGKLPVRYLGVPLLAKKLSVQDCKILIDKLYWASVYLLPNTVIKELDKLFKKFLWNVGDSVTGKARVAWKIVCRPKEQGGLGIKPLGKWNEVLLIRQAWFDMRESLPAVEWKSVIWFNQFIPKHGFILWLAIQKRLLTQDKMEKWNKGGQMLCGLCNTIRDSHEHLFFQCDFAKKKNVVDKLLLAATVYYVWQERNKRIFKAEKRSVDAISKLIKDCVKSKLMSIQVKKSKCVINLCRKWELRWFPALAVGQLGDAMSVDPSCWKFGGGSQCEQEFYPSSCDASYKSLYAKGWKPLA
ncbi:RNA-directed DNA polymerase, eukaryota, reverse transcriptase zinc-binding domain protein [Tanacetum coccineum]